MTGWAGFVGVTVLLVVLVLGLTRSTQRLIESGPPQVPGPSKTDEQGYRGETSPTALETGATAVDAGAASGEAKGATDEAGATAVDSGVATGKAKGATDEAGPTASDSGAATSKAKGATVEAGTATVEAESTSIEVEVGSEPSTSVPSLSTGAVIANVILTQGLVAVVLVGAALLFAIPPSALGWGSAGLSGVPAVGAGFALGIGLWLVSETVTTAIELIGFDVDEDFRGLLAPDTGIGWVGLLGVALPIVAVSEELLFRAAAIGVPAAGFGAPAWALVVLSSVAFALSHGIQGRAGVLVTGMLGVALAVAYVHLGSLVVVIVAHYVVNATEFLVHEGLGLDPVGRLA